MKPTKWSVVSEDLMKSLKQKNTEDNIDLEMCLSERTEMMNHINYYASNKVKKSALIADKFIEKGNAKLKSKEFEDSLAFYTKALSYAPQDSRSLSVAYAKRSEVLQCLCHYKESLQDVDMALSSGYDKFKSGELLMRKVKCLEELQCYEHAEQLLTDALSRLNELGNLDEKLVQKEISNVQQLKKSHRKKQVQEWKLPALKNGENPDFPNSSKCLKVVYSANKGFHVLADSDLKTGDVLFLEKAFSFVVHKNVCSGCSSRSVAPIPCLNCIEVQFCSERCRKIAWDGFHKFECGFQEFLKDTGIGHLALRIVFQAAANSENYCEMAKKVLDEAERKRREKDVSFKGSKYLNLCRLQSPKNLIAKEDYIQYKLTAGLLSLFAYNFTAFKSNTPNDVIVCGNMIFHHITQLISNAHAISSYRLSTNKNNPLVASEEHEQIASGIYPSICILNHSCEPSIINCFQQDYMIVRACKDIKKGEEVFNSYGINCRRMCRSERQELLKGQYFFECKCKACRMEYDPYDVLNSFKCEKCNGPVLRKSTSDTNAANPFKCLNCGCIEEFDEKKFKLEREVNYLICDGEYELYEESNVTYALEKLVKGYKLGRKLLYKFHEDLSNSCNLIAQCLFLMGDVKKCVTVLNSAILSVERRYGSHSIELASEAKKLSDIIRFHYEMMGFREVRKDVGYIEQIKFVGRYYYDLSEKIYKLLYGEDHPVIAEIRGNRILLI